MNSTSKKKITLTTVVALFLILCASQFAQATPPQPSLGTATVDGFYTTDWDLTVDFFADMYRAGINDANHPLESKLYLKYDPATSTLYVLVLTQGRPVLMEDDEAWVKIDTNKVVDGSYPAAVFAWVNPNTATGQAQGFEAKINLAQGEYMIDVHVNVYNTDDPLHPESETSRPLHVLNLTVVPEVAIGTTIVAVLAAAGTFAVYKHKKTKTL